MYAAAKGAVMAEDDQMNQSDRPERPEAEVVKKRRAVRKALRQARKQEGREKRRFNNTLVVLARMKPKRRVQ